MGNDHPVNLNISNLNSSRPMNPRKMSKASTIYRMPGNLTCEHHRIFACRRAARGYAAGWLFRLLDHIPVLDKHTSDIIDRNHPLDEYPIHQSSA